MACELGTPLVGCLGDGWCGLVVGDAIAQKNEFILPLWKPKAPELPLDLTCR